MALVLESGKETIEVIASRDGSVQCDAAAYGTYLQTLDEAVLDLVPGQVPTRFVLRKVLPFGMSQKIKTEQAGIDENGKVQVRMGYILDDVRAALIDVKDPGSPSLTFKKDSDGFVARDLVALLESAGIANELYAARQGASKASGPSKKS